VSPATIRKRTTKSGEARFQVLYRRGGRGYPIETAGTFRTQRDAKLRRDLVAGWIAQGLDPQVELAKTSAPRAARLTFAQWADRYVSSRIDYAAETTKNVNSHLKKIRGCALADSPIDEIIVADLQELAAAWAATMKPSSLARYFGTVRRIFDFADIDPNPARDKRINLPSIVQDEVNPPTAGHFLSMLEAMPSRYWLPLVVAEQTAMRIGEICSLEWGDVDEQAHRFRLRGGATKSRRPRWAQLPEWLMAIVADTLPREDRTAQRLVFPGMSADVAKNAMARACRTAGIPVYSPHDLRHRRLSLWHNDGVPARELADRAGHARASMTLDVYSHVMPVDEVPVERLERLLVMSR
jgi:integrase